MKRTILKLAAIFIAMVLLASLAACGENSDEKSLPAASDGSSLPDVSQPAAEATEQS